MFDIGNNIIAKTRIRVSVEVVKQLLLLKSQKLENYKDLDSLVGYSIKLMRKVKLFNLIKEEMNLGSLNYEAEKSNN